MPQVPHALEAADFEHHLRTFGRELSVPAGRLLIRLVAEEDVKAATVVLTRAFATTGYLPLDDAGWVAGGRAGGWRWGRARWARRAMRTPRVSMMASAWRGWRGRSPVQAMLNVHSLCTHFMLQAILPGDAAAAANGGAFSGAPVS